MWWLLACSPPPNPAVAADPEVAPRVALTLDRPLFRAGESVWIHAWRRAGDTLAPRTDLPLTLVLRDPDGVEVAAVALPGTQDITHLVIPRDAESGLWSVLAAGPDGRVTSTPFAVQREQALPWRVAVDPKLGDGSLDTTVTVTTPDGAPVVGQAVRVAVSVYGVMPTEATANTGPTGTAIVPVSLPAGTGSRATVRVWVDQAGGAAAHTRTIALPSRATSLRVLTEGGSSVVGLPVRHHLQATGDEGFGVPGTVTLWRGEGDAVGTVTLGPFGRAIVARPTPDLRFITLDTLRTPIAAPSAEGCAMEVDSAATVRCFPARDVTVETEAAGQASVIRTLHVGPDGQELRREADGAGPRSVRISEGDAPRAEAWLAGNRPLNLDAEFEGDQLRIHTTADGAPISADLLVTVVAEFTLSWTNGVGDLVDALLVWPDGLTRVPGPHGAVLPASPKMASPALDLARAPMLPWPEARWARSPAEEVGAPAPGSAWLPMNGVAESAGGPFGAQPERERVGITVRPASDTLRDAVAAQQSALTYCVFRERAWAPSLSGVLSFGWRSGPDGALTLVPRPSRLSRTEVARCIQSRLARLRSVPPDAAGTLDLRLESLLPPLESRPAAPPASIEPFAAAPDFPETQAFFVVHTDSSGAAAVTLPRLPPGRWRVTLAGVGGGAVGEAWRAR